MRLSALGNSDRPVGGGLGFGLRGGWADPGPRQGHEGPAAFEPTGEFSPGERQREGSRCETWSEPEVRIEAEKGATTEARLRQVAGRDRGRRIARLGTHRDAGGPALRGRRKVDYRITLPAGARIRVATVNGTVAVAGLTGAITASTTNGAIEISGAAGAVEASTVKWRDHGPIPDARSRFRQPVLDDEREHHGLGAGGSRGQAGGSHRERRSAQRPVPGVDGPYRAEPAGRAPWQGTRLPGAEHRQRRHPPPPRVRRAPRRLLRPLTSTPPRYDGPGGR